MSAAVILYNSKLRRVVDAYAKVMMVHGPVFCTSSESKSMQRCRSGIELKSGDSIRTGMGARITLSFTDSSILTLSENTMVTLKLLSQGVNRRSTSTFIQLTNGAIENHVEEQMPLGSRYEVETPDLQLSVRGTVFSVAHDEAESVSRVVVSEGIVSAKGRNDSANIHEGQGLFVREADDQFILQASLTAPEMRSMSPNQNYFPFELAWNETKGANKYRIKAFGGVDDQELLLDRFVDEPSVTIGDLRDGKVRFMVQAVDHLDLEGIASDVVLNIDAAPFPPVLLEPVHETRIQGKSVRLLWAQSGDAESYTLEVASDSQFNDIVVEVGDLPTGIGELSLPVEPGIYFWRIRSVSKDDEVGPVSKALSFEIAE